MWSSGIGSMPGGAVGSELDNARDYDEAQRVVLGEVSLPHLVEMPGRGAIASMVGRTLGLISELGFDLQPAGWRLSSRGVDQRRATSLLAQDLDVVSAIGVSGRFKVQVCGPWTLAAAVEKPRGERVLSDFGARRDLAEALAAGVVDHVADVRRRLPGADILVQVDEPALPAVMAGQVPTASGFHRHRSVDPPKISAGLEPVMAAITAAGATPVVHCCAAAVPVALLRGAGARGLLVDLEVLAAECYEPLAEALEAGDWIGLGIAGESQTQSALNARAHRFFDMLGLAPTEQTMLTSSCGMASSTPDAARALLSQLTVAAKSLSPPPL